MSEAPETLEELSQRVDKLVQYIDVMDEKHARLKEAHELILHTIAKTIHELEPVALENIRIVLRHTRTKTNGNAVDLQAIDDALTFFRPFE